MSYADADFQPASLLTGFRRYRVVMSALILRDIRSRYFGSAWGYLISLGWPLTHIGVLMILNYVFARVHPYGETALLWYATGIVPFMAFNYMARFITLGFVQNTPLLSFPAVKTLDIVMARVIVEILGAGMVFAIIYATLAAVGVDFFPVHAPTAFYGMAIGLLLGVGLGIIIALLSKIAPMWSVVGFLFLLVQWGISGIFFVPSHIPEIVRDILWYNPVMHSVALFRAGYYEGYAADWLDVGYAVKCGFGLLFVAMSVERIIRGRILQ
jgi:capsular polysaccharide transport system permease protein